MTNDEKTYRYWFVYLVPDEMVETFSSEVSDKIKKLYAYTDKKELIQTWKSQRKSNLFYIKKKKLTKDEVKLLTELMYHGRLLMASGVTRASDKFCKYDLCVTDREFNRANSELVFNMCTGIQRIGKNLFPMEVYTPFFRSILQVLCYGSTLFPGSEYDNADYETLGDYDFFKQFIHMYKDLLA